MPYGHCLLLFRVCFCDPYAAGLTLFEKLMKNHRYHTLHTHMYVCMDWLLEHTYVMSTEYTYKHIPSTCGPQSTASPHSYCLELSPPFLQGVPDVTCPSIRLTIPTLNPSAGTMKNLILPANTWHAGLVPGPVGGEMSETCCLLLPG